MNPFSLFHNKIEKLYDKKISSTGLAIFRITWGLVLFLEVREMFVFRELRFNTIPFVDYYELNFGPILFIWMILTLLIVIGYKTKHVTVINYLFSVLFFGSISTFEYHIFYTYVGVNFLLMFIPISNSFSVDNLLLKIKYSKVNYSHRIEEKVSVIYYYLPILVGIAFFYIDSVFYKLESQTWLDGLAVWRPAVIPNFNISDFSLILNNELIVRSMSYLTLGFEFFFIFTFFIKKMRWINFIIGFGLHFGILLIFPIPLFALAMCSIYFLMIPVSFWLNLRKMVSSNTSKITFIYDSECPLCMKTRVFIENVDLLNRIDFQPAQTAKGRFKELKEIDQIELITHIYSVSKKGKVYKGVDTYIHVLFHTLLFSPIALIISIPGIKHIGKFIYSYIASNREREVCDEAHCIMYSPPEMIDETKNIVSGVSIKKIKVLSLSLLITILAILQFNVSIKSGALGAKIDNTGVWETKIGSTILPLHQKTLRLSQIFLGITHHALFIDSHLIGFNNVFAITYIGDNNEEIWLPILDKTAKPGGYNSGGNWAKWNFRVNCVTYNEYRLTEGVIRFASFWAGKNEIDLNNAKFKIKLKKVKTPLRFEENFLMKSRDQDDWVDFGDLIWGDKIPTIHLNYEPIEVGSNEFKKVK